MSVTQAEVLHYCPFNDQLDEAGEKRVERREEDWAKESNYSFCRYWLLGFCRIKGIEDENGRQNSVRLGWACRMLKKEKKR
ncbi:Warthog protein 8, partial [Clarias magur]